MRSGRGSLRLPSNVGRRGDPFGNDRRVVEGIIFRYRANHHHHGHVTGPTSPMGAANAVPESVWNSRRPLSATSTPGTLRRRPARIQAGVASVAVGVVMVVSSGPRRPSPRHRRMLARDGVAVPDRHHEGTGVCQHHRQPMPVPGRHLSRRPSGLWRVPIHRWSRARV
jgi:hypothetical protein